MTFSTPVGGLTRCTGQGHFSIVVTVGGESETYLIHKSEMELDEFNEKRQAVLNRWRSAIKEAGAVSFAQVKSAIEGKTFQI